jgi:hypothetical protein
VSKFFLEKLGVDVQGSLTPDESLAVRRAFQKRHVLEHNNGTIDQRYISEVPEDGSLLGQQAALSPEELDVAADGVRKMVETLVACG